MAKTKKCDKFYIDQEGGKSRHASPQAVAILFVFTNGSELLVKPNELSDDMQYCGKFHGVNQKVTDSYSGTETVEDAYENAEGMYENLQEGRWINRAEGIVRTTVLAAALTRCKPQKYPTIETAATEIKANWDTAKRKAVLDPKTGVKALIAAYASVQAERAAERAAELVKKLGDSSEGVESL